ncbi:MAG: molybdopterin adenylyltransferase [Campylobacter sp.]|nr:molybdopterin adenylyltransferase [Campylobacter sp.]
MDKIKIGIITLSDRASIGEYDDKSGKAIKELINEWVLNDIEYFYKVIPDDEEMFRLNLLKLCDDIGCDMVVTTGGTGPAQRDITPEVTSLVCEKILPGFAEQMRAHSLKYVPTAILSRQIAGVRGNTFIINLPGQPKAIRECLEPVFSAIPYCIDLIGGRYIQTDESTMKIFRPKSAIKEK